MFTWWFWVLVLVAVVVALYFGIRSQMKTKSTLAGPLTPDELGIGPEADDENPEYHAGESAVEATVETYEDSARTLGHG